jgi:hypothetical protein
MKMCFVFQVTEVVRLEQQALLKVCEIFPFKFLVTYLPHLKSIVADQYYMNYIHRLNRKINYVKHRHRRLFDENMIIDCMYLKHEILWFLKYIRLANLYSSNILINKHEHLSMLYDKLFRDITEWKIRQISVKEFKVKNDIVYFVLDDD